MTKHAVITFSYSLTPAQLEVIDFYKGYNVPATWFIGTPEPDGSVEVIALGDGFIWSLSIDADGADGSTSEATVGDFSTGIEV